MSKLFSLRNKILFFSLLLAWLPLMFSGVSLITITQDELKSAVNDSLLNTARQLAKELDDMYLHAWRAPLSLLSRAVDNPRLGVEEKVSLLENGVRNLEDFVALQLLVEGFPPALFMDKTLSAELERSRLSPEQALKIPPAELPSREAKLRLLPAGKLNDSEKSWVMPLIMPLQNPVAGQSAYLSTHIGLGRVHQLIKSHPFNHQGRIYLLRKNGERLFANIPGDPPLESLERDALELLNGESSRAIRVMPYPGEDGVYKLGGYALSEKLPWAVLVSLDEADAYMVITRMRFQLMLWLGLGVALAVFGALWFSRRVTGPVLEIARVAGAVEKGDLSAKVPAWALKTGDEISFLGERINAMIKGLLENFMLQKFVSHSTLDAVREAGDQGIKLGGERRFATVFFSDIRNFTSFSEQVGPETVISMLNTYLRMQAGVVRKYHGDIDKYVGDELVAVFQGDNMVERAVRCACEIHWEMARLNQDFPEWNIAAGIGINTGEMVMGAMGSEDRMDYTILGDTVNLGARLCASAPPNKTLISETAFQYLGEHPDLEVLKLEPLQVKGKRRLVQTYEVTEHSSE